jgi:hypothetical protein
MAHSGVERSRGPIQLWTAIIFSRGAALGKAANGRRLGREFALPAKYPEDVSAWLNAA